MKIAFWSHMRGKSGVTSNLACISLYYAMRYKQKMLVFENHYNLINLENAFIKLKQSNLVQEERLCYYRYQGMDELIKKIHAGYQEKHLVENTAISILIEQYCYIPHSRIHNKEVFEYELYQVIEPLLGQAEQEAELVWIDTAAGFNLTTKEILDKADLVVVNLYQEPRMMKEFFENYSSLVSKAFFLIGNYSSQSKYTVKNIAKMFHISMEAISAIPYSLSYREALYDGTVPEFLQNNYFCTRRERAFEFIRGLRQTTEQLHKIITDKKEKEVCNTIEKL